jgi:putative spermidine/putrescine transport system ATP-binding protein
MEGVDITARRPNQRNIGMVFQSYALFPNMTVAGNIGFGLQVAGRPKQEIQQVVGEMLNLIQLPGMEDRYPWQLSGGQQQRVALARALAIRPKLLLLDEPLSALDAKVRVSLRNEIRAIQQKLGITTVYVTHDQEEALSLSDRVVVMNRGRIEQAGNPFEIYNFPQTYFVASFVGTLNLLPAQVTDADGGQLTVQNYTVLTAEPLSHYQDGDKVWLALRPEQLSIDGGSDGDNHLDGKLENISFLGSIVRLQLRVGDNLLTLDEFNNPRLALPTVGTMIPISFPRSACLILDHVEPSEP